MIRDSFTGPTGKTPVEVADTVLDAIRNDRFWIITHEDDTGGAATRLNTILASFPT